MNISQCVSYSYINPVYNRKNCDKLRRKTAYR